MSKSKRLKAAGLLTRDEFEIVIERVAVYTTRLRALEAERDQAIQAVQQAFALRIDSIESVIKADVSLCEKFAEAHRDELITGKAKSNGTSLARYGFRTGMPQLKLLSKWTWEKVIAALHGRGLGDKYIRTTEEPAKDIMLADLQAHGHLGESTEPGQVGVRLYQAETFYIEPKVEGAEPVKCHSTSSGQGGAS